MYAGLLLVFVTLAGIAAGALAGVAAWWQVLLVVVGYLVLAWVAYEACISSALGYGDVLREVDRCISLSGAEVEDASDASELFTGSAEP